jgi:hypothetical protein
MRERKNVDFGDAGWRAWLPTGLKGLYLNSHGSIGTPIIQRNLGAIGGLGLPIGLRGPFAGEPSRPPVPSRPMSHRRSNCPQSN